MAKLVDAGFFWGGTETWGASRAGRQAGLQETRPFRDPNPFVPVQIGEANRQPLKLLHRQVEGL